MTLAQKLQRHRVLFEKKEEITTPAKPSVPEEEPALSTVKTTEIPWEEPVAPATSTPKWEALEEVSPVMYPEVSPETTSTLPIYSLQQDMAFARRQQPQDMGEE